MRSSEREELELQRLLEEEYADHVRANFLAWCKHALAPLGQRPAAHHRLLIRELEAVARGDVKRLMVCMPPGSAKSTYASDLFPAWFLTRGRVSVIGASHTATLAESFSGRVQGRVREYGALLGYGLRNESRDRWATTNDCEYLAAGVGGPITGFRADLALLDDPVKSRQDADSETYRERTWAWYRADVYTRLKPGGRVVLIMTRWHEDDLGGRLLEAMAAGGEQWRVVKLPAVAGDNDPLNRAPGELLWNDDAYGYAALLAQAKATCEAVGGMRDWSALYQQEPRPNEGALFQVGRIPVLDAAPASPSRLVRGWDLAATEQVGTRDPDWTVGVKLARYDDGRFIVLDVVRLRGRPEDVEATVVATASRDGRGVTVSLPQDPGQAGKFQVLYLTRKLAGFRVESTPETGDKSTRAAPVAAQANSGNVALVREPWNAAFLDELRGFPSGIKDDQVDALSRAFAALLSGHTVTQRKIGY